MPLYLMHTCYCKLLSPFLLPLNTINIAWPQVLLGHVSCTGRQACRPCRFVGLVGQPTRLVSFYVAHFIDEPICMTDLKVADAELVSKLVL